MKLTFHGAARQVTGSSHIVTINGKNILLDCGLYQGKRKEAFEKNRQFQFDPKKIDAMILSHAHMDHSGNVPTLIKKGYKGPVYCTEATADLCRIMFRDCAYIQMRDVDYVNRKRIKQNKQLFEPLYTIEEADIACTHIEAIPYGKSFSPLDGIEATFFDAGHILGSAFTKISFSENGQRKNLMFTGDIGRRDIPILKNPEVIKDINYLITETTYGDRKHPPVEDVKGWLELFVNRVCKNKSKMIIPAFSIGRTQMIVYLLNQLHAENKICSLPVYVDSPLSSAATKIYDKHAECWDREAIRFMSSESRPFSFKGLHYTENVKESMLLNDAEGPMIIISASGMCEAGRILHHLKNSITDPNNTILIVGYQAHNTLGRRIAEKHPEIKIFGEKLALNAQVEELAALSAHADKFEMLDYFDRCGMDSVEHAFCVHGEDNALEHFAGCLSDAGVKNTHIPEPGEVFEV